MESRTSVLHVKMTLIQAAAVLLAVFVVGTTGWEWEKLHVKYSLIFGGYWKMPVTVNEIKNQSPQKFVLAGHDSELNVDFYSYPNDPRFFLLFDTYGNIAGVRTGYINSDLDRAAKKNGMTFPYDYSKISMFKSGNVWNTDIWYTSVLFVNPDKLISGGRNDTEGLVAEGVYVKLDGNWLEVARDECEVEKQGFTKQACFFGMGQHYFYKITPSSNCSEFQPFFALYNNGELIGFGLVPFGSFTHKDGGQKWFESVPRLAVEMIMPNGPECAYDWVDNFEVTSLHFFLKDYPRWTLCPMWRFKNCYK